MKPIEASRILSKINKCLENKEKFDAFEYAKLCEYGWQIFRHKYDQPSNLEEWVDQLLRRIN